MATTVSFSGGVVLAADALVNAAVRGFFRGLEIAIGILILLYQRSVTLLSDGPREVSRIVWHRGEHEVRLRGLMA